MALYVAAHPLPESYHTNNRGCAARAIVAHLPLYIIGLAFATESEDMTKTGRGPAFSKEEDCQIVRLRAAHYSFPQIARRLLIQRTAKSISTRHQRLEASGEAGRIRLAILENDAEPQSV